MEWSHLYGGILYKMCVVVWWWKVVSCGAVMQANCVLAKKEWEK